MSGKDVSIITLRMRVKDKHAAELRRQANEVNFVWNYCKETSRDAWSFNRQWLSAFDLGRLTSGSSKMLEVHSGTIKRVCDQYALSRDRARHASVRWRGRKSLGWVPFNTGNVTFNGKGFVILGKVFETTHLRPEVFEAARFCAGSFSADAKGRWHINIPVHLVRSASRQTGFVGIDLGLKTLASLSNGERIAMPRFYRESEQPLALSQRAKKSKRTRAIHAKIANRRKDFLHKASSDITKKFGTIVVGDVSPSKLAKTKMAKSVHDASWAGFKEMLSYKAIMHGGRMIEVSEAWTTQTCSSCGALPPSRPKGIAGLGIREWECSECGAVHDRDVNAAMNILRVGLDTLAEGARK